MTVTAPRIEVSRERNEPEFSSLSVRRQQLITGLSYVFPIVVTLVLTLLLVRPWSIPAWSILNEPGDALYVQTTLASSAQAGIFDTNLHLGWPNGYNPWGYPQLGILLQAVGVFFGIESSAAAAAWGLVLAAVLNAAACVYFLRSVVKDRVPILVGALAVALSISPAVLAPIGHLNVGAWFLVPVVFGAALRLDTASTRERVITGAVILGLAAVSPIWWVIVSAMLIGSLLLIAAILRSKRSLIASGVPLLGLLGALVFQYAIFRVNPNVGADGDRLPFASDLYGGHLVDLLAGSPLISSWFDGFPALQDGKSAEFKAIGLVPAVGAVVAVVVLVSMVGRRLRLRQVPAYKIQLLGQMTAVSVLFCLVGGFGNLQAGLAVLAGTTSPARAWSRLFLIVAMVGAAWVAAGVASWMRSKWFQDNYAHRSRYAGLALTSVAALGIVAISVADGVALDRRPTAAPNASAPEADAIAFLRANRHDCPVAQLPAEDYLVPKVPSVPEDAGQLAHRGFVPYLMAPEYMWSFGTVSGKKSSIDRLPNRVTPTDTAALAKDGVCAILYDQQLATAAVTRSAKIPGTNVTELGKPAFASPRYQVFLL